MRDAIDSSLTLPAYARGRWRDLYACTTARNLSSCCTNTAEWRRKRERPRRYVTDRLRWRIPLSSILATNLHHTRASREFVRETARSETKGDRKCASGCGTVIQHQRPW